MLPQVGKKKETYFAARKILQNFERHDHWQYLIGKEMVKRKASEKHRSQQRHVLSTPEKHLNKVLEMLQVVNKKAQSLLLTFNRFHILF